MASNVYLVRSGEAWVLLDAGWGDSAEPIRAAAEAVFGAGARPTAIALTHIHPDHSGAAGALARAWQVPVYVHPAEMPMAAGRYVPEFSMPLDRWVVVPVMRLLPARTRRRIEAAGDITDVVRALDPGGVVPGVPDWQWVHTPGHTPGHVAYLRRSDGVLVSGDAAVTVNLNSVSGMLLARQHLAGPPRYTTWNWAEALRSIAELAALEPRVLAPGHGRPLGDGAAQSLVRLAGRSRGGVRGGQQPRHPGVDGRRAAAKQETGEARKKWAATRIGLVRRRAGSTDVQSGELTGSLPFLSFGDGPPLVILPGLDGPNANPTGRARSFEVRRYRPFAKHFTVVCVRRRPGVPAGCSMADIAAEHARALTARFGKPVDVVGISTGGSVALQLAVDHPGVVRRLVLWASAARLSEQGRAVQRHYARLLRTGRQRRASAVAGSALGASRAGRAVAGAFMWLLARPLAPADVTDMVRTIEAEDCFDLTAELGSVTVPTLVVGGERDVFYGSEILRRTAAGIPGARLRVLPRLGHGAGVTSRRAHREVLGFLRSGTVEPPKSRT